MKTKVRELRPSDMDSFIELCISRDHFDREMAERRAEVVEWVAFQNPCNDGNPTYFIGVQGDRVVAHLGRMPTLFSVDGKPEVASYFHDLYVHPELRAQQAQGFFLSMKLYRNAEKASQSFCAMIWTNEINISLQKARKYTQMWTDHRVMLLGLSEKVEHLAPPFLARPATRAMRAMISAANWTNGLRLQSRAKVEAIESFDARFDILSEQTAPDLGVAPRKDHKYLNWKYTHRPRLNSSTYQLLDEGGQLAGFCVLINPDIVGTSSIAELVVRNNHPVGIHALLGKAISHLRKAGAERIEAVASDLIYSDALHQRLFRRDLRVPLFLAHSDRSPYAKRLHSPSHWHVSLGDSEGPF